MTPGPDEIGPPADPSPAASPVAEPPLVHRVPPIVDYEPPPPAPKAKETWRAGVTVLVGTWQALLSLFLGGLTVGLVGMSVESAWRGQWDGCTIATGTVYAAVTGLAAFNFAGAAIQSFRSGRRTGQPGDRP